MLGVSLKDIAKPFVRFNRLWRFDDQHAVCDRVKNKTAPSLSQTQMAATVRL